MTRSRWATGRASSSRACPPGQEIYDHDECDRWPGNGCPGTQVDRDPRPGTVVCSSSCRPNGSVVESTGVCACDDDHEVDSIGRCVAIVVDIYPNNGCDIAGRVNRNGNCDYTGCGSNADTDTDTDIDGNGYCVWVADYRYLNTSALHCSHCADGLVPDGRACRVCEDGESSPGVCRDCGTHAGWNGSACVCDTCFEDTDTGDGLACAAKTCGVNEACTVGNGQCSCIAGHHAHDALACHSDDTVHACPRDQHKHIHETCGCGDDHDCPPHASLTTHDATTATCACDDGYTDDPDVDGLQCEADDLCATVSCPTGASCRAGSCYCDACFDETRADGVLVACAARTCGVNETCSVGADECQCIADHHAHDTLACHDADTDHGGSCGPDQAGTPPDCTDCGRHSVPNAAGTACEACPSGQAEGFPGLCMPVGNCTRLGSYWPGAERFCVAAGLVLTNAKCPRSTCPGNSADNGWGICVCDPGYVYTLRAGALSGPVDCVGRTSELCGAAPDPGTCEPGGSWNSGTQRCDCDDGYQRSDDGRSCECATDDEEQTGYVASVLFPNPQSLFDGLRVGFVNTSSGNLTFRRRDIVTRAQGPVVFARVHDSRIAANADFGPGWRLSLAEELLVDGDAATYVDESGARHAFAWTGTAWTASPPTPRHGATTLDFADVGGIRIAVLADGDAVRTFEQSDAAGARYVVRLVRTPARELVFDYDGGRLAAVSHDGATLFEVERDRDGRIAALRDDHGRSVRYLYDADGRLDTVRDIAGNDWGYAYLDGGRLGAATAPDGRTYLAATYDHQGRVAQSVGGRLHTYGYTADGTTVAEDGGEVHAFTRNAVGATTALTSTGGVSWSLTLDASNRVSTLSLPDRTTSYTYDNGGRVTAATVADAVSGTTSMQSLDYDAHGRLTGVGGGRSVAVIYAGGHVHVADGDEAFEYHIDSEGRVASVQHGTETTIRAERDGAGDIVALSQGYRIVRFGRDALGRIVDTAYAGGEVARYFHDDLGSRVLSEYGHGGSVAYAYDATGSIVGVETTGRVGTVQRPTVTAEPAPGGPTRVGHEIPEPTSTDKRLAVLSGDYGRGSQPDYGVVALDRRLQAAARDPVEADVPRLGDARALLEVATPLFGYGAVYGFEEPSNPVLQPAEYLATESRTASDSDSCGLIRRHRVRVQAQIRDRLLAASNATSTDPISMAQCMNALDDVRNGVRSSDSQRLVSAFLAVERRIVGCGTTGGCTPVHSQSFPSGNGDGYHADFTVESGVACLP